MKKVTSFDPPLFSIGAIITGLMSDLLDARATSSVIMMYLAVPTVSDKLFHMRMMSFA